MGEGWGIELWDRFKEVCDVVNDDTRFSVDKHCSRGIAQLDSSL